MILKIVNDKEIFRIVSSSLHSAWLSASIKHCQSVWHPTSRPSPAQPRPPVVSGVYESLCEVMSVTWQMSSVTLIINHVQHCYYLLALLLSRPVSIIKSYIILQPLSALTSPPLLLSSSALLARYLSKCLSHSQNISDISTQSRDDIKMKPSVLPPSTPTLSSNIGWLETSLDDPEQLCTCS